jgi:hypothetical protein
MIRAQNKMFPERLKMINARVIMPTENERGAISWDRGVVVGKFFRVVPQTPREIAALRLLTHRVDKFAPADGNGAIVSGEALEKFDA